MRCLACVGDTACLCEGRDWRAFVPSEDFVECAKDRAAQNPDRTIVIESVCAPSD